MGRKPGLPRRGARGGIALGAAAVAAAVLWASPAAAASSCSAATLSGFGVADVSIASATGVPATATEPEYCSVLGTVTTRGEGAGPGSAEFLLKLPAVWNNRLVFFGCGGNCGSVKAVSANDTDVAEALGLGYATVGTDAGHEQDPATPDPTWILLGVGKPNEPAIVDFFYRAVHQVAVAAKALTAAYYAAALDDAYFDGCSTGGRQALMEGDRYPEDFDGLIAGDPVMALDDQRAATIKQAKSFLAPASYMPFSLIPSIDNAVNASCDAVDGVADGLIQNPALCPFAPQSLAGTVLTAAQARALDHYLKKLVDGNGMPIAPGGIVGDYATSGFELEAEISTPAVDPTAAEPWGGIGRGPSAWTLGDSGIRYYVERDPSFDVNNDWPQHDDVIAAAAVALLKARTGAGDSDDPAKLHQFLRQDRKLILYHGFSDALASPYRSTSFYKALARAEQGYTALQTHARLFMVPGMGHCSGGSGPNRFETLTALDSWVRKGVAPEAIVAANSASGRSMPLCKFPEEASYAGGPVDAASSWTCQPRDRRLLQSGLDGNVAGADADYDAGPPGPKPDD